ncbi:MAG: hypothetical protein IPM21_06495 [Acidobacteria bacterium]|nr:hypothetical protein [Acidobacteriota bacterium]
MLAIHWAKQNTTTPILANGIRPSFRRRHGEQKSSKGVYVYPFSRNATLSGNWRRNLKTWDRNLGNYNGFVFRLQEDDFPLIAGYWFLNRSSYEDTSIRTIEELYEKFGDFFSGAILEPSPEGFEYNWEDFEIIVPRRIEPKRILKVIRDREPKRRIFRKTLKDPDLLI